MDKDTILFEDVSFANLIGEVYTNTKKKEKQIDGLVDQLKGLIRNVTDASMLVSLIREYLEISVKNDDNLVKLTAIVQRLLSASGKAAEEGGSLTEGEREELMRVAEDLVDETRAA